MEQKKREMAAVFLLPEIIVCTLTSDREWIHVVNVERLLLLSIEPAQTGMRTRRKRKKEKSTSVVCAFVHANLWEAPS